MTVEDLAAYLGFSTSQIYKMWEKRDIPGAKIGKALRFDRLVIDKWMESQLVKPLKKDRNYVTERPRKFVTTADIVIDKVQSTS